MSHHRPFLVLWVVAVAASVTAFVLHLAMRSKAMHLGYELGRARAEQARLREVRRVMELEVASYHTPQRVEAVARTLLHMEPPSPDRIISMPAVGLSVRSEAAAVASAGARGAGAVRASAQPAAQAAGHGAQAAGHGAQAAQGRGAAPSEGGSGKEPPQGAQGAATELLVPRITPPRAAGASSAPGGGGP